MCFHISNSVRSTLLKTKLLVCSLSVSRATVRKKLKEKKPNGGWGDLRDWKLCSTLTLQPPS